jgi:thiamine-phosphate pyrophosphorylase
MSYDLARKILGPAKIIGVSAGNIDEANKAIKDGADYLGIGPIFETKTKPDAGIPTGITLIKEIRKITDKPIAAIGGINPENAEEVARAGADMICAISSVIISQNPSREIEKIQKIYS